MPRSRSLLRLLRLLCLVLVLAPLTGARADDAGAGVGAEPEVDAGSAEAPEAPADASDKAGWLHLQTKKELRWGCDSQGGAPYVFQDPMDPNHLIGFEVDLAEALAKRLATLDDADLRGRVLGALVNVTDPERVSRALALTFDPRLRKQEVLSPIYAMSSELKTRDAAWKYLTEHFEQAVAASPESHASYLPWVVAGFCDAERAKEQEAFLEPRAPKYPGMGQNVRQALEAERLCAAMVAAQRQSARAFFANLKGGR